MGNKQVVVVTQRFDPHTDEVLKVLYKWKQDVTRLNTEEIPLQVHMAAYLQGLDVHWDGHFIGPLEHNIHISEVKSVWWRRPGKYMLPPTMSPLEHEFVEMEIRQLLFGIWESMDYFWVSHPNKIMQSSWKLEQLQRAKQMGFDVPSTLVTNEPEQVREFYTTHAGKIVYKAMTDPLSVANRINWDVKNPNNKTFMCRTKMMTADKMESIDLIQRSPSMFQEYIEKEIELRITIIGTEIFPAAIHSQMSEESKIDWRNFNADVSFAKAKLPPEIADRCLRFVRSYGLYYSAMDLILTPDGRYVFLENNPNGQFTFIQQRVPELQMVEAMASLLAQGTC